VLDVPYGAAAVAVGTVTDLIVTDYHVPTFTAVVLYATFVAQRETLGLREPVH
jgi:S-adenosylmethionine:tRNA-ribosyltransferase-isomerase (queuine synthetase)